MLDEVDYLLSILGKKGYAAMDYRCPLILQIRMMLGSSLMTWKVPWMMRYLPVFEYELEDEEDRWDNWCTHWYLPTCLPCTNSWWEWCSCWVRSSAQADSCHSRWWHWAMEGASQSQLRQECLTSTEDLPYILCCWVWSCCNVCWQNHPCSMLYDLVVSFRFKNCSHCSRLVDEFSFCSIYKYMFPYLEAHVIWVSKRMDAVDKFNVNK